MLRALTGVVLLSLLALPVRAEEVVTVAIDKYRFEPKTVSVRPGTVVEWRNDEKRTSHSVIVQGQPESDRLFPGETYRFRFDTPGRYEIRCGPHPDMMGTVEVTR